MPYFDPAADLLLIHEDVRDHDELHEIAKEVEKEVIDRYTERETTRRYGGFLPSFHRYQEGDFFYEVRLAGYAPDPADAEGYDADRSQWSGFADAMRRAIAKAVSHRLRHYDDNTGMKSERIDGYSYERWSAHDGPRGWDDSLLIYDHRHRAFV